MRHRKTYKQVKSVFHPAAEIGIIVSDVDVALISNDSLGLGGSSNSDPSRAHLFRRKQRAAAAHYNQPGLRQSRQRPPRTGSGGLLGATPLLLEIAPQAAFFPHRQIDPHKPRLRVAAIRGLQLAQEKG